MANKEIYQLAAECFSSNGLVIDLKPNNDSFLDCKLHLENDEKAYNSFWIFQPVDKDLITNKELILDSNPTIFTISNTSSLSNEVVTYLPDGTLAMKEFTGDPIQLWMLTEVLPGYYTVSSLDNPALVFSTPDQSMEEGDSVTVRYYNNDVTQIWAIDIKESLETIIKKAYNFNQWVGSPNEIEGYVISGVNFDIVAQGLLPSFVTRFKVAVNDLVSTDITYMESANILKINFDKSYVVFLDHRIKIWAIDVFGRELLILDRLIGNDPVGVGK